MDRIQGINSSFEWCWLTDVQLVYILPELSRFMKNKIVSMMLMCLTYTHSCSGTCRIVLCGNYTGSNVTIVVVFMWV